MVIVPLLIILMLMSLLFLVIGIALIEYFYYHRAWFEAYNDFYRLCWHEFVQNYCDYANKVCFK